MGNKEKTRKYFQKIIDDLNENLNNLKKEENMYIDTPRIVAGVRKNIEDRKQQIHYYTELLAEYQDDGWAATKSSYKSKSIKKTTGYE